MPSPHHEHARTDTFQWRRRYNTNCICSFCAVRVVGTACISPADPLVSCPATDMTLGCRRVGKLNFAGFNVVKINAIANLAFWWQARWLKFARLFCKVNRHIDFRSQNRRSRSRAIDYSEFKCSLPEHLYFLYVIMCSSGSPAQAISLNVTWPGPQSHLKPLMVVLSALIFTQVPPPHRFGLSAHSSLSVNISGEQHFYATNSNGNNSRNERK